MANPSSGKPVDIKISTVVAVSVLIRTADLAVLTASMHAMTGGAADYFDNEFAVLDVSACAEETIDWSGIITLLKSCNLNPVAVRGACAAMEAGIRANRLSIDNLAHPRAEPAPEPISQAAPARAPAAAPVVAPAPIAAGTMIIDTPVRAGQRIYARGGDLVVTAVVNSGAELIADGSIHIYAPLRGRALAGATGDTSARIFAMGMEAELVSVAGTYRTFESGVPKDIAKKAVQVRLSGDRIDVLAV